MKNFIKFIIFSIVLLSQYVFSSDDVSRWSTVIACNNNKVKVIGTSFSGKYAATLLRIVVEDKELIRELKETTLLPETVFASEDKIDVHSSSSLYNHGGIDWTHYVNNNLKLYMGILYPQEDNESFHLYLYVNVIPTEKDKKTVAFYVVKKGLSDCKVSEPISRFLGFPSTNF